MAGLGMPYKVVDEKLSAGRGDEFSASRIVSSKAILVDKAVYYLSYFCTLVRPEVHPEHI
jgi:hypothetical protein